jgi:small-conductance mechanosensitive channel
MDRLIANIEFLLSSFGLEPARTFWGNTILEYGMAIVLFVALTVFFKLLQVIILRRLSGLAQRTHTDVDDTLIRIVRSVRPQFYGFLALYLALQPLVLVSWLDKTLTATLLIFAVFQIVKAVGILVDYVGEKKIAKERAEAGDVDSGSIAAIELLRSVAKAAIWVFGFVLVLSNLGIEVTSLIAGLGIGGIAVAFALQAILGDLFSSFTIYFDKPFRVGDFIVVGDLAGTVERVGIKTTRLRALQGEEIVLSNADLTSSRIHNYKRMEKRRIVFSFGVVYETPMEKLKKIPELVGDVFMSVPNADLERSHFKAFGDFALNFEVVYHVLSGDYNEYMDIQQNVNLALTEMFEREKIAFAYPTQTIYLQK